MRVQAAYQNDSAWVAGSEEDVEAVVIVDLEGVDYEKS